MKFSQYHKCIIDIKKYSKACLNWPLKEDQKLVFKTDYRLMQVKSIAEYSIQPAFSFQLSLRPLFFLFLSGHLRKVLLYEIHYITES